MTTLARSRGNAETARGAASGSTDAACAGRASAATILPMAVMLSKTYQAFRAAGAPDDTARAAAEEIAGFENRLTRLAVMLALVLAGVASLVVKTFFT